MEGIIFNIKRYAVHDGPGIRTTVFLKGCRLRCRWCHNPESQYTEAEAMWQIRKLGGREYREAETVGYAITPEQLLDEIMRDSIAYEISGGGVTFSGGEPLLQSEFLEECLRLCAEHDIRTCVDTAGVAPDEALERVCPYTDLFLYDIKTLNAEKFRTYIGQGFNEACRHLQTIAERGVETVVRIPVIPGFNNDLQSMAEIIRFLRPLQGIDTVSLLPYHRLGADKYHRLGRSWGMGDAASLTEADIAGLKAQFCEAGFKTRTYS